MTTQAYWPYWGKADPAHVGPADHHLAVFHMLDVAAVAEVLLQRSPALQAKFSRSLVELDRVVPTAALIAALHDLGKLDIQFQLKAASVGLRLAPERADVKHVQSTGFDHGSWGFRYAMDPRDVGAVAKGLLGGAGVAYWLRAVAGHHGAIPTKSSAPGLAYASRAPDIAARKAFIEDAVALFVARGAALPLTKAAPFSAVVLLAGLVSVADWIGSNTDWFPYQQEPVELSRYYERALEQAVRALDGLDIGIARPTGNHFPQLFPGKTPRDVQALVEVMPLSGPSLVVIEAQMGMGKTEAALALASRFLARGDATGLYIALPTMATSNAMLSRVEDVLPRLYEGGRVNLALAHGQARSHLKLEALVKRSFAPRRYGPDAEDEEATAVCSTWYLARKRALLSDVGVGTVDQALQAVLAIKHHFVRAYGLASSVVVIDEVHAYDVYMEVILERLIEWLGALEAPVVLLSATLPHARRASLVRAYQRGLNHEASGEDELVPEEATEAQSAYPLVTLASARSVEHYALSTRSPERVFQLDLRAEQTDGELERRIEAAVAAGAYVVWIRNTVREAQEAFDSLAHLSPTLFHARLRPVDRRVIEAGVLGTFGPDERDRSRGRLLIATQVVEQSLDLDFDWMITDLAPVDLVLQRTGRLHRHARTRPPGFEKPLLTVIHPTLPEALSFGDSGHVYDVVTLYLTYVLLRNAGCLSLPQDLRPMVEALYDPALRSRAINASPNVSALLLAQAKLETAVDRRRLHAAKACIPPTDYETSALETRADDEEAVEALTRDGQSQRLWLVVWDAAQDLAFLLGEDAPLPELRPDDAEAWRIAQRIQDQLISVPAYDWKRIEKGARPRGDVKAFEQWLTTAERFLKEMRLSGAIIVPVSRRGAANDAPFVGRVDETVGNKTEQRRVEYRFLRGLSFPRADQ